MERAHVYKRIESEREFQIAKWGGLKAGNVEHPDTNPHWKLAVLMEEVGEVSKALIDGEPMARVRSELIQVAAVAVAWLESM